ncbi:hypothetical protein NUW58_g9245 [Xylaria curta]|uniref:Uncharacterized protein n=1 Tax=Xylaria curta TaxID=42375 RepID=A0ACC1MZ99_9PEZI|nr:hypothetical protein NUW58_g9245 [Xylaria curta]
MTLELTLASNGNLKPQRQGVATTGVEDWTCTEQMIRASGKFRESFTMFGRGQREDLDDDEAMELATKLRTNIAAVLDEEARKGKL